MISLQLAQIVPVTEAEGPGKRFAIWFQGCPLRCPSCCNPEMLPFEGGRAHALEDVLAQIFAVAETEDVEGITLLGGEPFAHAGVSSQLATRVQSHGLSVMIFSGFTLEELQGRQEPEVDRLLDHTDILVDGPYDKEQPESERRWIGSRNQRIHFLSSRYQAEDPCWQAPNTLELRFSKGELSVNGFPSRETKEFWNRPQKMTQSSSSPVTEVISGQSMASRRKNLQRSHLRALSPADLNLIESTLRDHKIETRRRASELLGTVALSTKSAALLASTLSDPAWTVREAWHGPLRESLSAQARSESFRQVGESLLQTVQTQILKDSNALVREGAMDLICIWPEPLQRSRKVSELLQLLDAGTLRTPESQRLIRSLAKVYGVVGAEHQASILQSLSQTTKNSHRKIRREAVIALGQLQPMPLEVASDLLVRCFEQDSSVREAAHAGLTSFYDACPETLRDFPLRNFLAKVDLQAEPGRALRQFVEILNSRKLPNLETSVVEVCRRRLLWLQSRTGPEPRAIEEPRETPPGLQAFLDFCATLKSETAHQETNWMLGQALLLVTRSPAA